jgi:hypothetical protein
VVVDGLPEALETWDDDRPGSVQEGGQDGADAGVGDDGPRPPYLLDHLVEGEVVPARGAGRADRGGPVLDEELRSVRQLRERREQAVEAGLVRPYGDEDHDPETTLPR